MVKIKDLQKLALQHNISLDSDEYASAVIEFRAASDSAEQQEIFDNFKSLLAAGKKTNSQESQVETIINTPTPPDELQEQKPEPEASQPPTQKTEPKKKNEIKNTALQEVTAEKSSDNSEKETDDQTPEIIIYDTPEEVGRPNPKEQRFSFLTPSFKKAVIETLNNNPAINHDELISEIVAIVGLPLNKQKAAVQTLKMKYQITEQRDTKKTTPKPKKIIKKPNPKPQPAKKEEPKMTDDTLFETQLADWKKANLSVTDIPLELEQQLREYFNDNGKSLKGFKYDAPQPEPTLIEPQNTASPKKVTLHSKGPDSIPQKKKGLEGVAEHWETWCKETVFKDGDHKGEIKREFKRQEADTGLKFNIEPTTAQKATGDKGTTVHFASEENVVMPLSDYDYFIELTKSLKDSLDVEVLVLGEDIDDSKYFNRAIAAAYANGMEVENCPQDLDLREEALEGIPAKDLALLLQKQVFDRTDEVEFSTLKQALERNYYLQKSMLPKDEKPSLDMANMKFKTDYEKNRAVVAMLNQGYKIENIGRIDFSFEHIEGFKKEELALLRQNIDPEKQTYDDCKNMFGSLSEEEKKEPWDISDEKDKISPIALNTIIAAAYAKELKLEGLNQLDLSPEAIQGLPLEARTNLCKIHKELVSSKTRTGKAAQIRKAAQLRKTAQTEKNPQAQATNQQTTLIPPTNDLGRDY